MSDFSKNKIFGIHGASKQFYEFEMYRIEGDYKDLINVLLKIGGVYIFTHRNVSAKDGASARHRLIYCGATEDIHACLMEHPKMPEIMAAGANCLCFYPEPMACLRDSTEKDIVAAYKFRCN